MILPPTIPIIFLFLGALAIGAGDLARLHHPTGIMVITSALALVAVLTLRDALPFTQVVAAWQPISVFTVPISFRVDQTAWILALGLMLVLNATALTWIGFPGRHLAAPRALSLLLTAAALAGVFASNLLTLALAWGVLDIIFVCALLLRSGAGVGRRAALAIVLNAASTLCVWVAALLIENQNGSLYWHLFNAQEAPRAWLIAAAVIRVGLYPFHQWLPVELGNEPDRAVLLFAVPSAAGLALLVRMAIAQALPTASIVPLLAVLSMVIGAVLAWRSVEPRGGLPYVALSMSGFAVMNATLGGAPGVLTAATLNWMFVTVSLFIARGLDRRMPFWSIGVLIAGLSLAGLPGTLGFAVQQPMIAGLIATQQWAVLLISLTAEAILIAAITGLILSETSAGTPKTTVRKVAFGIAVALGAAPLVLFALDPALIPGLPSISVLLGGLNALGWLAFVAPIIGGALLVRRARHLSFGTAFGVPPMWSGVLRLEWLSTFVFYVAEWLTIILRRLAGVIEGEGGLLWTVVIIVIVVAIYTGTVQH